MKEVNQNGREINLTIIKQGTEVTGELSTSDDIRIDGKFFGDIETKGKLVISKQGYVEGNVRGADILINGKAKGDFQVDNNFHLSPEGIFAGSVETRFINISETSIFDGTCVISQNKKPNQFKHIENEFYTKKPSQFEKIQDKIPGNGLAAPIRETEKEGDKKPALNQKKEQSQEQNKEKSKEQSKEQNKETESANDGNKTSFFSSKISQIEFIK
jgi:cytoskeletal protein CcmA (bactofilin family)